MSISRSYLLQEAEFNKYHKEERRLGVMKCKVVKE